MLRLSIAGAVVNFIYLSSLWISTKQVRSADLGDSCRHTHDEYVILVDVMFLFVRAAIGYSLAFVKVKNLEKELVQMVQDRKRFGDSDEDDQQRAVGVSELKERVKRAIEAQHCCVHSMSTAYARLVLHCSNFENHKEDERFFECIYFFVCSVVKLGVVANHWRHIEEELGFLFRGAQFSANIKLHATTAYQDGQVANSVEPPDASSPTSHSGTRSFLSGVGTGGGGSCNSNSAGNNNTNSNGTGARKSLPIANTKDAVERLKANAGSSVFEAPKSRISHFAASVPVRRIVAELQTTKNRAARNMELSQALRDRIHKQRSEDHRRQVEAAMTPRHTMNVQTLDEEPTHIYQEHIHDSFTSTESLATHNRRACEACSQVRSDQLSNPLLNNNYLEQGI
ncbi:hypothetical protein PHMEG_00011886 [Phytophthora megakarya]|uniref:Uncharacterized protein n=1 Tax=Phytophthora megakarya TaxID=4795 RepID=A0A225WA57_9STRA|nr:hypothetical protein PHMEG_00011886 [Phytophthora megakarya]